MTATLAVLWLLQTVGAPTRPTPANVSGVVTSARTGAPIGDARIVVVIESDGRTVAGSRDVQTNRDGRFVVEDVRPGPVTITVSTIGYIFVRRRIDVPAGGVELTIPLAEGTGTYEEAVTVSPAGVQVPAGEVQELSSGALQDLRGVAADDPVRAVQALPGVAASDDFQAEFSVRGSAYRHLGLAIDGVATPLLFHAVRGTEDTGSIAMINTDVVSRAALHTGSHPARHGSWLGATLEFDMREGSRDRIALRTAVSGTNASTVVEGPLTPARRGSWLVSIRKSYVDWLVKKIDPDITGTIGFLDAQAKVAYDIAPRQSLQFLVLSGSANYRDVTANSANEIARARSTSTLASLGWRYASNRVLLSQRFSVVTNRFRNTGSFFQELDYGTTSAGIWRGDVTAPIGEWTLEGGAAAERVATTTVFRNFQTVTGTLARVRAERSSNDRRTLSSGWMSVGGHPMNTGVTAGVRLSHDTFSQTAHASPWLLIERDLRFARLTMATSRRVQYSTLENIAAAPEPLRPEQAWLADIGLKGALTKTIGWTVTGFRRGESNILRQTSENKLVSGSRINESLFPTLASNLFGTSRGVDVAIQRRSEHGPSGWFAYSWAHTRYRDRVTNEEFDGDFDQRHTLNAYVQQRLSYRLRVSAKFRYGSNFPIVGYYSGTHDLLFLGPDRNQVRLPAYLRFDLSASRTFTFTRSRLTLFVEIMNVTNRDNYGPADGGIRNNLSAVEFSEKLIPILPSAGMLLEF
jgi:hypothetical protein